MEKAFPESDFGVNRNRFRTGKSSLKPEITAFLTMQFETR